METSHVTAAGVKQSSPLSPGSGSPVPPFPPAAQQYVLQVHSRAGSRALLLSQERPTAVRRLRRSQIWVCPQWTGLLDTLHPELKEVMMNWQDFIWFCTESDPVAPMRSIENNIEQTIFSLLVSFTDGGHNDFSNRLSFLTVNRSWKKL